MPLKLAFTPTASLNPATPAPPAYRSWADAVAPEKIHPIKSTIQSKMWGWRRALAFVPRAVPVAAFAGITDSKQSAARNWRSLIGREFFME